MSFSLLSLLLLAPSGLTVDEFKTLHAELQPAKDEAWRTIPWKVSLVEAHLARLKGRMGKAGAKDAEIEASDEMLQEAVRMLDEEGR